MNALQENVRSNDFGDAITKEAKSAEVDDRMRKLRLSSRTDSPVALMSPQPDRAV